MLETKPVRLLAASALAIGLVAASCRVRSTERHAEGKAVKAIASAAPVAATAAASSAVEAGPPAAADATAPVSSPVAIIAVAGLGTDSAHVASAVSATKASRDALEVGASCLDAAVAGVVELEDDADLNAGTGAALRLDGSAELDAAVMDSEGKFGAVAGISSVKNPSKVARAVGDTPHLILAGAGATRFARALGFESFEPRTETGFERRRALSSRAVEVDAGVADSDLVVWPDGGAGALQSPGFRAYLERSRAAVARVRPPASAVHSNAALGADSATASAGAAATNAAAHSGPARPLGPHSSDAGSQPAPTGSDTVAVLVRCAAGRFAGAASSGGPWLSLPGRVGDVPVPGGALYVGEKGAVFVTGSGERILERLFARGVYDELSSSGSLDATLRWALSQMPAERLAVAILDSQQARVAPESATAWAVSDPTLRTSEGAR